jgi:PEP-CTERM motif
LENIMKKVLFSLIACLALASSARADIYDSGNLGWTWPASPGTTAPFAHVFALPSLTSINSISIDMSHTWGNDLDVTLVGPSGTYDLLTAATAIGGSGNFDLGLAAGSGAPGNVARYVFTGAGATNWVAPFSPAGNYNAEAWVAGASAAGVWTLNVGDVIGGDGGSIGNLVIDYTPDAIPEPGSALALLGLAGLGLIRRVRS